MKKKTLVFSLLMSACVLVKAQYANQTLSNLTAPTAVNKDLRPGAHNAYNLGEPSKSWKNVSLTGILYLKSEPFLRILGTGGTFVGTNAGNSTTGSFNTGFGYNTLLKNTTGTNNTANGYKALYSNTTGNSNSANGYQALYSNTTGANNTASGYQSLFSNTTIDDNVAYGYQAMYSNVSGTDNTAVGFKSLFSNTGGSHNSALGYGALRDNTIGFSNTAVGQGALLVNTTGYGNTGIGTEALHFNSNGVGNTAIGVGVLAINMTGARNTAVGFSALATNRNASYNTAIGDDAMGRNLTGENNTAIGHSAGFVISDGTYPYETNTNACTFLGTGSNVGGFNQYNTTVIGYNARAAADNQVVIGNTSVNSIGGYANWTNFSDGRYKKNIKEDVPGLSFIKALRAVTYTLDIDGVNKTNPPAGKAQMPKDEKFAKFAPVNEEAGKKEIDLANKAVTEKNKIVYTGFVAQEVEAAAKKLDYDFSGVKKPANNKDFYGLRYAEFVVPLVKAVQELSVENEDIKKQNDDLKLQNEKLESRLAAIEQMLGGKNGLGLVTLSNNSLGQNIPNPANGKMTIPFNLSSVYQRATIVITEVASGKTLKTIAVTPGQKAVTVQLDNMASGTYAYSLIANNKTLDSKKMVVAR